MKKIYVSPSILSADFANLEKDIQKVKDAETKFAEIEAEVKKAGGKIDVTILVLFLH